MNIVSSQKSTTIGRQIKQNLEEKIYYLNKNNKELNNELVKANTENKVLKEQIEELKKDNDKYKKYHDISASKEKEQMSILEDKVLFMENQLNDISKENNELRILDDKNRKEIEILQKEKENIQNKYENKKEEYNQLILKYNQLDKQAKEYQLAKISIENAHKLKEEDIVFKQNNKKQIISDLQSKIKQYQNELRKKRNSNNCLN